MGISKTSKMTDNLFSETLETSSGQINEEKKTRTNTHTRTHAHTHTYTDILSYWEAPEHTM